MQDISSLPDWSLPLVFLLAVWTLFWKGLGLWHAARNKNTVWFTVMLLINTVGVLELIYLFAVRKVKPSKLFKV